MAERLISMYRRTALTETAGFFCHHILQCTTYTQCDKRGRGCFPAVFGYREKREKITKRNEKLRTSVLMTPHALKDANHKHELLRRHEPVGTLRSSSSLLLSVPRCNLEFDSRAFRISAPKIWNSLPVNIRDSSLHLKTHYFQLAYLSP